MIFSAYGGIKNCTKDCQRTTPHTIYEKAPWMCKVRADNDDPNDYAWDLLDLGKHLFISSHTCMV